MAGRRGHVAVNRGRGRLPAALSSGTLAAHGIEANGQEGDHANHEDISSSHFRRHRTDPRRLRPAPARTARATRRAGRARSGGSSRPCWTRRTCRTRRACRTCRAGGAGRREGRRRRARCGRTRRTGGTCRPSGAGRQHDPPGHDQVRRIGVRRRVQRRRGAAEHRPGGSHAQPAPRRMAGGSLWRDCRILRAGVAVARLSPALPPPAQASLRRRSFMPGRRRSPAQASAGDKAV